MNMLLSEKEVEKIMENLSFKKYSFETYLKESEDKNFSNEFQFAPFEINFNLLNYIHADIRKYYIVKLSNGFQIRAWGINKTI